MSDNIGGNKMTDKELRKLKRSELIEILYYMRQEIDELNEKNKKLEERLDMFIKDAVNDKTEKSDEPKEEKKRSSELNYQTEFQPFPMNLRQSEYRLLL